MRRIPVSFGTKDLDHTGITQDVSKTGLFIRTTKMYSPGSVLRINLLIPNNGTTVISGKVVRTYLHPPYSSLAKNGVGVEIDSSEQHYLTHVVSVQD